MTSLRERVLYDLQARRKRVLDGKINSIPSPFKRFSDDFIGIEKARLFLITSFTKVGKTQFSSYLFLYNSILYAYYHPEQVRVKIFYYPLEETPEQITLRFMSFLLYYLSNKEIIKSPVELSSTANKAIDKEILDKFDEDEFKNILKFFEESVIFSDSTNPSGVWFECQRYAKDHGTIHKTKVNYKDEFGNETVGEKFDYYEPDDPEEYRIIFYDHLALTSPEKGMDLRQTMAKLSEYFVMLRNRYGFSAVIIQQQAITDNLEAVKSNKLRPTIANLGDAKTIARDIDCCIGLFSPYVYELKEYLGYDVTKFKNNLRFAEILLNRHGQANGIIALFFLGQCNYWCELPLPNDKVKLEQWYKYLNKLRGVPDSINNTNTLFLTLNTNFIKSSLKVNLKSYLCRLFHLNNKK